MNPAEQPKPAVARVLLGAGVAVSALALCLGVALFGQHRSNLQLQTELKDAGRWVASTRDALKKQAERNRRLEARLEELNHTLAETTAPLQSSPQPAVNARPPRQPAVRDRKTALRELATAGIPAPTFSMTTNTAGVEVESCWLPELQDRAGRRLASDVRFSSLHGRRLVFRAVTGPPFAVDVDDVHPLLLACLDVDADAAKQAQADLDRQKRLQAEAAEKDRLARAEAERKWRETAAKLLAEQRKQEQARLQAGAEQETKRLSAATDHLLALAALATAEAAYERAVSPPYVVAYPSYNWHFTPFVYPWPASYHFSWNRPFRFHQPFRFLPPSQYSPAAAVQFTVSRPAVFP